MDMDANAADTDTNCNAAATDADDTDADDTDIDDANADNADGLLQMYRRPVLHNRHLIKKALHIRMPFLLFFPTRAMNLSYFSLSSLSSWSSLTHRLDISWKTSVSTSRDSPQTKDFS